MPVVSVVIPAYNYAHFLPETLGNVLQQSYSDWECIVVDDGSTDDTREVVAKFLRKDPRFRYIHQENRGLPGARNTGIKEAQGSYIQLLDADDLIEREKLAEHVSFLEQQPAVDIVYSEVRFFFTDSPEVRRYTIFGENRPWMPKVSGNGREILSKLIKRNIMVVNAPLIRREVFMDCGLFDETLRSHEDWDFWLRCALSGKSFRFLDRPNTFALVRSHSDSMSHVRGRMYETNLLVRRKLQKVLKDHELRRDNHILYGITGFKLARETLEKGNRRTGAVLLMRFGRWADGISQLFYCLKLLIFSVKKST